MISLHLSLPIDLKFDIRAFGWMASVEVCPLKWSFHNWRLGDGEFMSAFGPFCLASVRSNA